MMRRAAKVILTIFVFATLFGIGINLEPRGSVAQQSVESGEPMFKMPKSGPFSPESISVPNAKAIAAWARSGHADAASEAFSHWNDEGAIPPPECAICHSGGLVFGRTTVWTATRRVCQKSPFR